MTFGEFSNGSTARGCLISGHFTKFDGKFIGTRRLHFGNVNLRLNPGDDGEFPQYVHKPILNGRNWSSNQFLVRLGELSTDYYWAIAYRFSHIPERVFDAMRSLEEHNGATGGSEPVEPFDSGL